MSITNLHITGESEPASSESDKEVVELTKAGTPPVMTHANGHLTSNHVNGVSR